MNGQDHFFEQIPAYYSDKLTFTERLSFEKEYHKNPELVKACQDFLLLQKSIRKKNKLNFLAQMATKGNHPGIPMPALDLEDKHRYISGQVLSPDKVQKIQVQLQKSEALKKEMVLQRIIVEALRKKKKQSFIEQQKTRQVIPMSFRKVFRRKLMSRAAAFIGLIALSTFAIFKLGSTNAPTIAVYEDENINHLINNEESIPGLLSTQEPFSNWQSFGNDNNYWQLSPNGKSLTPPLSSKPSFFVSPYELINIEIDLKISLTDKASKTDDAFFGLFFGSKHLPANEEDLYDLLLFDWRSGKNKNCESTEPVRSGFSLSQLKGILPEGCEKNQLFYFLNNSVEEAPLFNLLDQKNYDSLPLDTHGSLNIQLLYTSSQIDIKLNGASLFTREGTFSPGHFGLYHFSLESHYAFQVRYQNTNKEGQPKDSLDNPFIRFHQKDFSRAIPSFRSYIQNASDYYKLIGKFYLANSLLVDANSDDKNQVEEAIHLLEELQPQGQVSFILSETITYYLALAYLKNNQADLAQPLLEELLETNNPYTDDAKNLLQAPPTFREKIWSKIKHPFSNS